MNPTSALKTELPARKNPPDRMRDLAGGGILGKNVLNPEKGNRKPDVSDLLYQDPSGFFFIFGSSCFR